MAQGLSQIRPHSGERGGAPEKSSHHVEQLKASLKRFNSEKSEAAQSDVRHKNNMATITEPKDIPPKLDEAVKKALSEKVAPPPSAGGGGDGGGGLGGLLGGLAQNFGGGGGGGGGGGSEAAAPSAPAAPAPAAPAPAAEPAAAAPADTGEGGGAAETAVPPPSAVEPAGETGAGAASTSADGAANEPAAGAAGESSTLSDNGPVANADPVSAQEEKAGPLDAFQETRSALTESFRSSNALNEESMTRLGRMMTGFEDRMAGLAMTKIEAYQRKHGTCPPEVSQKILSETRQKIDDTYKHLTEMVGTKQGSNELFKQADRASLSENLLFHLADPRTFDQGSNGTCWINSSTSSYGLTTQPDDMARFMKEISLTGQFQAHADGAGNGPRNVQFHSGMFYATNQERNWKISNALGGSARSPVGMFMDEAMTEMVGKHRADAGDYYGSWGAKRIMTMISGEAPPAPRGRLWSASVNRQMGSEDMQTMLEHGGFQTYSPGHLQSVQFVPEHKTAWNGKDGLTYNGQALKLDGSDPFSGYVVLDNQWGERSDFVTHYMNANGQVQDIQDQRYNHFDPGKVNNERQVTIRPGNDSNGGGGGGGGGFVPDGGGGGLVNILPSILKNIVDGGGTADKKDLTTPGGWQALLMALLKLAEKEVAAGKPGPSVELLRKVCQETKVDDVVDDQTMRRMQRVLKKASRQVVRPVPVKKA